LKIPTQEALILHPIFPSCSTLGPVSCDPFRDPVWSCILLFECGEFCGGSQSFSMALGAHRWIRSKPLKSLADKGLMRTSLRNRFAMFRAIALPRRFFMLALVNFLAQISPCSSRRPQRWRNADRKRFALVWPLEKSVRTQVARIGEPSHLRRFREESTNSRRRLVRYLVVQAASKRFFGGNSPRHERRRNES
jgi:hypothetical protein